MKAGMESEGVRIEVVDPSTSVTYPILSLTIISPSRPFNMKMLRLLSMEYSLDITTSLALVDLESTVCFMTSHSAHIWQKQLKGRA